MAGGGEGVDCRCRTVPHRWRSTQKEMRCPPDPGPIPTKKKPLGCAGGKKPTPSRTSDGHFLWINSLSHASPFFERSPHFCTSAVHDLFLPRFVPVAPLSNKLLAFSFSFSLYFWGYDILREMCLLYFGRCKRYCSCIR